MTRCNLLYFLGSWIKERFDKIVEKYKENKGNNLEIIYFIIVILFYRKIEIMQLRIGKSK